MFATYLEPSKKCKTLLFFQQKITLNLFSALK